MSKETLDCPFTAAIYRANRELKEGFASHSGTLLKKVILQIIFYQKDEPKFIYELPLSPSLKEMPNEIEEMLKVQHSLAFEKSSHLKRSLTYLKGISKTKHFLNTKSTIRKLSLNTYSIGNWPKQKENAIVRLKCHPEALDSLIKYSKQTKNSWAADFNGSLSIQELVHFANAANLNHCVWLEQPLQVGRMFPSLVKNFLSPIYADEEMEYLSPELFSMSGFGGLVIKPIRHDFNDFINWMKFAQEKCIPCIIGAPVCDAISMAICRFFNQYATLKLKEIGLDSFFLGPYETEDLFTSNRFTINKKLVDYVKKNYIHIGNYEIL